MPRILPLAIGLAVLLGGLPRPAGAETTAGPAGLILGPGFVSGSGRAAAASSLWRAGAGPAGGAWRGPAVGRAGGAAGGPAGRMSPAAAAASPWIRSLPMRARPGSAPAVPAGPGERCRRAIAAAEAAEGIPPRLLQAIALVESGRPATGSATMLPWPWTVDVDGRGGFFPDEAAAVAAVRAARAAGQASIDVGCLQVNLLHHPHAFADLAAAFDPDANARFAAAFLRRLRAKTLSWGAAAAAYHSETPSLAAPYQARVMAAWAGLNGDPARLPAPALLAGPFAGFTPGAAMPMPRANPVRIMRLPGAGGMRGRFGHSLADYRARPIPIDRGG